MKTIIDNIQIAAVTSWLPLNNLEMTSLSSEYGEKEVASIIKATGVERVRIADKNDTSSDMCFRAAEHLIQQEHIDKNEIDGLVLYHKQWTIFFLRLQLSFKSGLNSIKMLYV